MFRLKDKRKDKSFGKGLVELNTLSIGDFFVHYNCYCIVVNTHKHQYSVEVIAFDDKVKPRNAVLLGTALVKKIDNVKLTIKDND